MDYLYIKLRILNLKGFSNIVSFSGPFPYAFRKASEFNLHRFSHHHFFLMKIITLNKKKYNVAFSIRLIFFFFTIHVICSSYTIQ